jgi:hypothetical protein
MDERDNVRTHITRIDNVITELRNIQVDVDPEDAAISLLISLPLSWQTLVTAVEINAGDTKLEYEKVKAQVVAEDLHHSANSSDKPADSAFFSKGTTCSWCFGRGHTETQCRQKARGAPRRTKRDKQAKDKGKKGERATDSKGSARKEDRNTAEKDTAFTTASSDVKPSTPQVEWEDHTLSAIPTTQWCVDSGHTPHDTRPVIIRGIHNSLQRSHLNSQQRRPDRTRHQHHLCYFRT